MTLLSASRDIQDNPESQTANNKYLCETAEKIHAAGIEVTCQVKTGTPAQVTNNLVNQQKVDLVVVTTRGSTGEKNWLSEGLSSKLVHLLDIPVLLVQVYESRPPEALHIGRILVTLDSSVFSEQILPYAHLFGHALNCELMLICVPAVPESQKYRAPVRVINTIRRQAETSMKKTCAMLPSVCVRKA